MPRRVTATEEGLLPHYKVRVVLPGAILHLASATEPQVKVVGAQLRIEAEWIVESDYGDAIGWIDWDKVAAVTWRWSP